MYNEVNILTVYAYKCIQLTAVINVSERTVERKLRGKIYFGDLLQLWAWQLYFDDWASLNYAIRYYVNI